jgi:hypothetical protein
MPIAFTLSKADKMNKKITVGLIAGITAGIAIYLISKMISEKKSIRQDGKDRSARPKRKYAYEYSL